MSERKYDQDEIVRRIKDGQYCAQIASEMGIASDETVRRVARKFNLAFAKKGWGIHKVKLVHDMPSSKHPLHNIWHGILQRCYEPNYHNYNRYGGRGIRVHEPWRSSFKAFAEWVYDNLGKRPKGYQLDRWPDNDGHYEPGNLRWATARQNTRNRSTTTSTPGVVIVRTKSGKWQVNLQLLVGSFADRRDADIRRETMYAKWGETLDRITEWVDAA